MLIPNAAPRSASTFTGRISFETAADVPHPEGGKKKSIIPTGYGTSVASAFESAHSKFIERGNTMYQEQILKIFREFEKEESRGSWIDAFADKDSLTYKLYKQK